MGLLFPQGLAGAVFHVLRLGEGQGAVVVPLVCRAGRQRKHQRLVIPEDVPVVQVEIVVPGRSPLEGVVKGGVQVVTLAVHRYHVPGVAVFHARSGAASLRATMQGSCTASHRAFTVLAMPSHTPTP